MITKVILKNWMSHKDTHIEFKTGKILIHGRNGSGKTSIIEGIVYGLFGEIREGYRKINRTTKKEYIRDGSDTATVEVEFLINNHNYRIIRTLSRNKPERVAMYIDNNKISENDVEIRNRVMRILNVDESIFGNVFYGAQDGLYQIMELQPKQIKEYLDRILGIEEFQSRIDRLKKMINDGERKIKELSSIVDTYRKDFEEYQRELERLKKHEQERETHQKQYNQLVSKYEQMRKNENDIKQRYQKYLQSSQRLGQIEGQLKSIEEELIRISDEIRKLGGFEGIDGRILELDKEIESLNSIRENARKAREEKIRLETEISNVKTSMNELRSQRDTLYEQIQHDNTRLEELQRQRSEIKIVSPIQDNQIKQYILGVTLVLMAAITINIYLIGITLPILLLVYRRYQELERIRLETENRAREMDISIESLKSKISNSEITIKSLDERLSSIDTELRAKVERLESIQIQDESKVSEREKELIAERERLKNLRETRHQIDEKEKKREELNNERKKLLEEIKRLDIDERRYNAWNYEYAKISSELKALKDTLDRDDRIIEQSKQRIDYFRLKADEYRSKQERLEILRKTVQELSEIHKRMEDIQIRRRKSLIDRINMYFNMYWNYLYSSHIYSDPKIEVEDSGYVLMIRAGNLQVTADRLSGGEKTLYALALRMAILSLVTKNLRIMILDEPTHNLDERAIDSLIDNINKLYLEHIDQFIIITHDEKLKTDIAWNMVVSLYRDNFADTSVNYTKVEVQ